MKKLSALSLLFLISLAASAQINLNSGIEILFKQAKTNLTATEKAEMYKQTGFKLSKDKKQFVADYDEASEYPFDAFVYPTDLNKDGKEEIFIVFGNSYTSGMSGSSVVLFIKNKEGKYKSQLGFSGITPDVMPTKSLGYPDLLIGGPGFEHPVWRWNGKDYDFYKQIKEKDLAKIKKLSIEEVSKTYVAGKQ